MATYYVDPVSGSNGNAGTSFGTAWATTAYALSVAASNDTVFLCATGMETLSGALTITTTNTLLVGANSSGVVDGTQYNFKQADGAAIFTASGTYNLNLANAKFTLATTTPGTPIVFPSTGLTAPTIINNVECLDSGKTYFLDQGGQGVNGFLINCNIANTSTSVMNNASNRATLLPQTSRFTDCVSFDRAGSTNSHFFQCIFDNTATLGSHYRGRSSYVSCIFYGTSGTAVQLGDRVTSYEPGEFTNCAFVNCNRAVDATASNPSPGYFYNCLFYNNTNADSFVSPATSYVNCVTGVDPQFRDPANGDFSYPFTSPMRGAGRAI